MQAIQTRVNRWNKVMAIAGSTCSKPIPRCPGLDEKANHANAAMHLARTLGWDVDGRSPWWQGGCLPDGSWCWVNFSNDSASVLHVYTFNVLFGAVG